MWLSASPSVRLQSLRENLQHGLSSRLQCPSGHIHLLQHGAPGAALLMSVFVLSHLLQENLCPGTWSTTAFSFSDLAFHVAVSHLLSESLQPVWCFCPFFNLFAQRCSQLGWGAQLCPVVGLLPALAGVGWTWPRTALGVPSQGLPLHCQLLDTCTQESSRKKAGYFKLQRKHCGKICGFIV